MQYICCASFSVSFDKMYYSYPFLLILFGVRCLSADPGDLFGDGESVLADAGIFNSPGGSSVSASDGADEPFLFATSPDDYSDGQALDQFSFTDSHESNDPNTLAALPPALISLDDDNQTPSAFHDAPPGEDRGPEYWAPKLAVCCEGRHNNMKCVWFTWDNPICEVFNNVRCCEQVLPSGEARDCDFNIKRWPGIIRGIFDFLRTPIPLPESIPLGGFWSPTE